MKSRGSMTGDAATPVASGETNRMNDGDNIGRPRELGGRERDVAKAEPLCISGVVDAILEVGRQRMIVLDNLRAALQSGDSDRALGLARQLCGLYEEGNRTDSRIN